MSKKCLTSHYKEMLVHPLQGYHNPLAATGQVLSSSTAAPLLTSAERSVSHQL